MQYIPPNNLRGHDLAPLLAARGLDPDWIQLHNFDPHSPQNVARHTYSDIAALVPFHYRSAVPTLPELRQWVDGLVATAKEAQAERNSPIASVAHGPSLLLLGVTGVGKTYEAYGAMRELAVTGVRCWWQVTTAADLYAALRPRHGIDAEAEFRRYRDTPLLLVDDLGAEGKPSAFTEEVNFRLINHRYERHLPTLFTSNADAGQLRDRLGDRVTSRLREMCQRIAMKGNDRRRAA
ncbi:ATP-binding protein [Streptomyces sp. SID8352]|uniref:ATP-binding protein n=1 Tax=Streptomyces sp. SID8352 TaxID=2690338 RepID=UPI001367A10D|nr:ATP-binding protein [Streptomyces sp. SID8352]MYU20774.1 ATP-binding protein [Streptomyces sp. SID8352]